MFFVCVFICIVVIYLFAYLFVCLCMCPFASAGWLVCVLGEGDCVEEEVDSVAEFLLHIHRLGAGVLSACSAKYPRLGGEGRGRGERAGRGGGTSGSCILSHR